MQFNAATLEASVSQGKWTDYLRERTECLEEWVCELLRKNQALRMALQKEQSQHLHREDTAPTQSFPGLYQASFPSGQPASRTELPNLPFDMDTGSCTRKGCAEIREAIIQNVAVKDHTCEASKDVA